MQRKLIGLAFVLALLVAGCGGASSEGNHSSGSSSEPQPPVPLPDLDGGFDITPIGPDPEIHTAHTPAEGAWFIDYGIARHYDEVTVDFAFDNGRNFFDFYEFYPLLRLHARIDQRRTTYEPGLNKRNVFGIRYLGSTATMGEDAVKPASYHSPETPENTYPTVLDANMLIRRKNYRRRPLGYVFFPIDRSDRPELPVQNSEELWWALGNGFKPVFDVPDTRAEAIYAMARDILREWVSDEMSTYEKLRAIFEWITTRNTYDYDILAEESRDKRGSTNTAFYLEGVFEYRRAVCDAFSKAFVLLAGIEGLDVVRSLGYAPPAGEEPLGPGHAWNYARLDEDGPYYLACTTWGAIGGNLRGVRLSHVDYTAFLTGHSFFKGQSGGKIEFREYVTEDLDISDLPYVPSPWDSDALEGFPEYDFKLDSEAEMACAVKKAVKACGKEAFSIEFEDGRGYGKEKMTEMFDACLNEALAAENMERREYNVREFPLFFDADLFLVFAEGQELEDV